MKDFISNIGSSIGSKNLIKMGMVVIVVIICIVGFSLIYYNFFYSKSFTEIENIMKNAAMEYYSENKSELPQTIGQTQEIKVSTLVDGDYMKSISEYVKNEDVACKAKVNVTNINNTYRFNPLLDCGRYHNYKTITDYIKEHEKIVVEKDGLYQVNNDYVYRGEKVRNYVDFAGISWRIIRIENNKLLLVYNGKLTTKSWDNRYNKSKDSNFGINDYSVSRIKDLLNNMYNSSKLFSADDKLLLSNFSLYTGKVGEEDNDKDGHMAKSVVINDQFIGLISAYEFMNASLDVDCNKASAMSCGNYNYLADYDYNYWTLTGDKNTTYKVFKFFSEEGISLATASSMAYPRPVVAIVDDAIYVSGNGTKAKPYIFK